MRSAPPAPPPSLGTGKGPNVQLSTPSRISSSGAAAGPTIRSSNAPDDGGNQRSSEAIRARPSGARTHLMMEAIRGHQRQSEPAHLELERTCVQSHQAQSVTITISAPSIRGHQRSSVIISAPSIRGHQRSSVIISAPEVIRGPQSSSVPPQSAAFSAPVVRGGHQSQSMAISGPQRAPVVRTIPTGEGVRRS